MATAPRIPSPAQPWRGAVITGLLQTLERPGTWAVALAGFLARGGILVLLLPIVVLPTPAALHTTISPLVVPFLFGEVAPGFVVLVVSLAAGVIAWVLVGGFVGSWSDAHLAIDADEDADFAPGPTAIDRQRVLDVVPGVLVARVVAHAPLILALVWGATRIIQVVYDEVTTPFEVVTPLAIRVVAAAPDAVAAVVVAWLLGEAAGGLAAREVALGGRRPLRAVAEGWLGLVRRPAASLGLLVVTNATLVVAVAPGVLAAGAAWRWVRAVLFERAGPAEHVLSIGALACLWLALVALAAFAAAFRANAWTAEWLRHHARPRAAAATEPPIGWPVGTIGDPESTRPGGWPSSGASGTV